MTEPITPATQHTVITPETGSRLEQLAEAYPAAKQAADEARARLDTITDAIKLELTMAAPGADKVDLRAPSLLAPLRLSARTKWSLDSKKLKSEAPEVWVRFARQSSYWELRAITHRGQP